MPRRPKKRQTKKQGLAMMPTRCGYNLIRGIHACITIIYISGLGILPYFICLLGAEVARSFGFTFVFAFVLHVVHFIRGFILF